MESIKDVSEEHWLQPPKVCLLWQGLLRISETELAELPLALQFYLGQSVLLAILQAKVAERVVRAMTLENLNIDNQYGKEDAPVQPSGHTMGRIKYLQRSGFGSEPE